MVLSEAIVIMLRSLWDFPLIITADSLYLTAGFFNFTVGRNEKGFVELNLQYYSEF